MTAQSWKLHSTTVDIWENTCYVEFISSYSFANFSILCRYEQRSRYQVLTVDLRPLSYCCAAMLELDGAAHRGSSVFCSDCNARLAHVTSICTTFSPLQWIDLAYGETFEQFHELWGAWIADSSVDPLDKILTQASAGNDVREFVASLLSAQEELLKSTAGAAGFPGLISMELSPSWR